ncbi:bifunctional diguanylate cyclase/phosphodiesterase [Gilvimarinus algae]|uniref:Bifunctional diguanylate cyclase/phosphodiesterase n=1 Tax=Gilvimarinus algae TaxID=3058037 RepID=A0ABT8TJB2_9GAMM|nr:bifunctional diguanylate cyclase/phosphodiesterase [Gilvimarinus sp. SDUM040014]MDO3384183.1 bifunctional diguanylate cyclase/phosphodiesterase [Gilvimarinus sp. SDUM040014]
MVQHLQSHLQDIIDKQQLYAVFQPVINVINCTIVGYEALIRGPSGSGLERPDQLFAAAAGAGQLARLEYACREAACLSFMAQQLPGKLFLNMTPLSFTDSQYRDGVTMAILRRLKLDPERVVFELTEKQPMEEYELLSSACEHFQRQGFAVAIDDLGAGYAGLRIWSELNPDYVKIDRHFVSGIERSAVKREFVRFMMDIAHRIGNKVIAEGIETADEFKTLVSMGIEYMQGYYIARPSREPTLQMPEHVNEARATAMPLSRDTFHHTLREVTVTERGITPEISAGEVVKMFRSDVRLTCLPVVTEDQKPLGMISRSELLNTFSWRYSYELHANKPISGFISARTLMMDINSDLNSAGRLVTEDPAQNLSVDIIVCERDRYVGVAKVRNILRSIADEKLRAARHSNPLTALPGNVPLYEWIDRLLCQRADFIVAYCDINHFKPFNDAFGYSCGDDVIILLGQLLRQVVDPELDFIGHVGGDDFVVVFKSRDWQARCEQLLERFSQSVETQMPPEQLDYWIEDRHGQRRRFGPLTIAIGCVHPDPEQCFTHHQVAMLLADAKHRAKALGGQQLFVSRRRSPETA